MRPRIRVALIAACLLLAPAAQAVVHVTGDGFGNTTAPLDDPGFASVGVSGNGLSGIYLGNGWVLSAHHVGEQGFTFGGVFYPAVVGSRVQLETSPGVGADLELVRILGDPPLPAPVLSSGSPLVGDVVTMIGNGWDREPSETCWNSSFTEVSCPPPGPQAAFRGYARLGTQRALRWGRNAVIASGDLWEIGGRSTIAFETAFDESEASDEAQAVVGDSGGGVFLKRGSQWELVGVLFAVTAFTNQPANTAVYDQSTLVVDLDPYVPQIEALLNAPPEIPLSPLPGAALAAALVLGVARRALRRAA